VIAARHIAMPTQNIGEWWIRLQSRSGVGGFMGDPRLRALEHDPEKWQPVFRRDHAPNKKGGDDAIDHIRL
jgi:hypothetical protein